MKKGNKKIVEKVVEPMKDQSGTRIFITDDLQKFELDSVQFGKYSNLVKYMENDDEISFNKINSDAFNYVVRFLDNRKECEPKEIHAPLKVNKDIYLILEKCDADLVTDLKAEGYEKYERVLHAACYLQMDSFQKMLYTGIAIDFISQDIEKIKEVFGVSNLTVEDEEALKSDLRSYLQLHKS